MNRLFCLLLCVLVISCNSGESKKIKVKRIKAHEYDEEKAEVADFIEEYLNMAFDSSLQKRNNLWDSKLLYHMQDRFLLEYTSRKFLLENPPIILGVRKTEGVFYVNILFEKGDKPLKIMELKLLRDPLERLYFVDRFSENLSTYKKRIIDGHEFYYSPSLKADTAAEKESIRYNQFIADFFERPPQKLRVVVCKDVVEYTDLQSFIFTENMNLNYQHGGLAMPEESLLFSINGSPSYPHEMVHIYSNHLNDFYWFDEGLATYLGGSVEKDLDYHLQKIADSLEEHDFSEIPKNKRVDELTSYKYSIGGLLIKIAMEEYEGKETVFKLMNYGKTEDDFFKALKDVFGVERSELDAFIKKKIRTYYL